MSLAKLKTKIQERIIELHGPTYQGFSNQEAVNLSIERGTVELQRVLSMLEIEERFILERRDIDFERWFSSASEKKRLKIEELNWFLG